MTERFQIRLDALMAAAAAADHIACLRAGGFPAVGFRQVMTERLQDGLHGFPTAAAHTGLRAGLRTGGLLTGHLGEVMAQGLQRNLIPDISTDGAGLRHCSGLGTGRL